MAGRSKATEPVEVEEKEPSFPDLLGQARLSLAKELVRATDVDDGGMDVTYAGLLASTLSTLKEL